MIPVSMLEEVLWAFSSRKLLSCTPALFDYPMPLSTKHPHFLNSLPHLAVSELFYPFRSHKSLEEYRLRRSKACKRRSNLGFRDTALSLSPTGMLPLPLGNGHAAPGHSFTPVIKKRKLCVDSQWCTRCWMKGLEMRRTGAPARWPTRRATRCRRSNISGTPARCSCTAKRLQTETLPALPPS